MLKSGCVQKLNTNWRAKYWDYSDQQECIGKSRFGSTRNCAANLRMFCSVPNYLDYFTILGRFPYGRLYARPAREAPNDRVGP